TYGNTTDQPISMQYRKDGRWHTAYYLYDGQGNVRQLTNSRGQVIATYNYLPFGEMMNKGMRGQGIEGNEGIGMNWGEENGLRNTITYQGREYDRDSGLYYYRARYQDPRLGRFLEVDPILREVPEYTAGNSWPAASGNSGCGCGGNSANQNNNLMNVYSPSSNVIFTPAYIFVNNNPINLRDPSGEIPKPSCIICAVLIANDFYDILKKIQKLTTKCLAKKTNCGTYQSCLFEALKQSFPSGVKEIENTLKKQECEKCGEQIIGTGTGGASGWLMWKFRQLEPSFPTSPIFAP
ncbi:MAG: RHS repeat-associated core domain-containing protein, partial [Candidatus Omnitrophica bacterium]|nr:RHS repeat-associated core domain-containing protein [Candidatus Omnitrophota bacterium]